MENVQKITILGGGTLGRGLAITIATEKLNITLIERREDEAKAAQRNIERYLVGNNKFVQQ